jgi:hypothetical protein
MAIDFWKLSGQPNSYSTLDGYTGAAMPHQGVFIVTFKAKSDSETIIMVSGNADIYFELTPEWKEYSCEMDTHTFISINDEGGYYDAFIKDIKVVEKPLDKLTNNMLDGFGAAGKNIWWWDSYEILPQILEENGQYLEPGTYEIEYEGRSDSEYGTFFFWTVQTGKDTIQSIYQPLTFEWEKYYHRLTVPELADYFVSDGDETDASSVRNITVRKFNTKWKLHENARVIDSQSLNSGSGQNVSEVIYQLNKGTYTLSCVSNSGTLYARDITTSDNSANNLAVVDHTAQPKQFTLATPRKVAIRHYGGSVEKPMLNLGSVPLPYEPKYGERFRTNATPKVKVPKKNLFDGLLISGYFGNGVFISLGTYRLSDNFIPVIPNSKYSFTINNKNPVDGCRVTWFDSSKVYINSTIDLLNIVLPSNAYYVKFHFHINSINYVEGDKIQFEKGNPTPFEPYTEVLPPAKRILTSKRVLEAKR